MLAIAFGLAGCAFAGLLPAILISGGIVGALGVLCCVITAFVYPKPLTNPILQALILQKPYFRTQQVCRLWVGQIVFVCLSFVLFHFLETQTQLNTRLSLVETGYIVKALQQHPFGLGLLPFIIYGVLGLGLAYFSICVGEKPILTRAFSLKRAFSLAEAGHPMTNLALFWQSCICSVIEIAITLSLVFISTFALFWLCETVNTCFGWDSLFSVPLRTLFILGLMMFFFRRINKQLIAWMSKHQISVGQILIIYILSFSLFVLWLHAAGDWLTSIMPAPLPDSEKSYFAGMFNEKSLQVRIQYLIWGWWSIWIPWLTSLVARSAIGCSILQALIQALLLPAIVFAVGVYYPDRVDWTLIYAWLQLPAIQLLVLFGIFFSLWVIGGEMRTMGDVLKGDMLPIGRISNRPLTRWMTVLIFWLTCYVPSGFILGWLPMQFSVTFFGLFMNSAVAIFIGIWGMTLIRRFAPSSPVKRGKGMAIY
ncbi:MAG TPA: hypothetical protein VNK03_00500 [Gammaproteobacteria bacterium]|nr:hypothetical protein [Gammaproteobacteria bacterium]